MLLVDRLEDSLPDTNVVEGRFGGVEAQVGAVGALQRLADYARAARHDSLGVARRRRVESVELLRPKSRFRGTRILNPRQFQAIDIGNSFDVVVRVPGEGDRAALVPLFEDPGPAANYRWLFEISSLLDRLVRNDLVARVGQGDQEVRVRPGQNEFQGLRVDHLDFGDRSQIRRVGLQRDLALIAVANVVRNDGPPVDGGDVVPFCVWAQFEDVGSRVG